MSKTILITGATSGIGLACAKESAKMGYIVYAGFRKEADGKMLGELHTNIHPIKLDIANPDDIESASKILNENLTHLDALFNNAGISHSGPTECIPMNEFRRVMEINVSSQVELTQKIIPLLRKANDPRLIFTGSMAGVFSKPLIGVYAASKFALEGLVDCLRIELAPWNIKVSLIQPARVRTEIFKKSLGDAISAKEIMSENAKELYLPLVNVGIKSIENAEGEGSDVSVVVDVFKHALTAKKPKERYPVAGDARTQNLVKKVLPDFIVDKIIMGKLKKLGM